MPLADSWETYKMSFACQLMTAAYDNQIAAAAIGSIIPCVIWHVYSLMLVYTLYDKQHAIFH